VLPVVEADARVAVDTKIIASVKIVAAAAAGARYVLCSRAIFFLLLSLFSAFILRTSSETKQRIKKFRQLTRKGVSNKVT
jgi:hypothetical protein